MSRICFAIYVSGTVQGVGFRYSTQCQAKALSLIGHVYNTDDGRVEILACGESEQVYALIDWLKAGGPPSAKIDQIIFEPKGLIDQQEFHIRY